MKTPTKPLIVSAAVLVAAPYVVDVMFYSGKLGTKSPPKAALTFATATGGSTAAISLVVNPIIGTEYRVERPLPPFPTLTQHT